MEKIARRFVRGDCNGHGSHDLPGERVPSRQVRTVLHLKGKIFQYFVALAGRHAARKLVWEAQTTLVAERAWARGSPRWLIIVAGLTSRLAPGQARRSFQQPALRKGHTAEVVPNT